MKKRFKTIALLLLVMCALCAALCSCGANEPKDADELWALVDRAMEKPTSYEARSQMELSMDIEGLDMQMTSSIFQIVSGLGTEQLYSYVESRSLLVSEAMEMSESYYSLEAYYDGYVFLNSTESGRKEQKICAPMTQQTYLSYDTDGYEISSMGVTDGATKTLAKDEKTGSWVASYTDYSEQTLEGFYDMLNIASLGVFTLEDVEIVLRVDKTFLVESITMTFDVSVEDEENDSPVTGIADRTASSSADVMCKMTLSYSHYDSAEPITAPLNTDAYDEVDDIGVLWDVERAMLDSFEAERGELTLRLEQSFKIGSEVQEQSSFDTVIFGTDSSGYTFDIASKIEGDDALYVIRYRNGVLTAGTDYAELSESEARDYIWYYYFNFVGFMSSNVYDVDTMSDGVYRVTCASGLAESYKETFAQLGLSYVKAEETLIVTFSGDTLVKLESTVTVNGYLMQNGQKLDAVMTVHSITNYK